jgi:hypothetical protein
MAKRHSRPSPHYRYEHYDPKQLVWLGALVDRGAGAR